MLARAIASVHAQTRRPDAIVVRLDGSGAGSADTRNRALAEVRTEWVAFLDSDDELYPPHLQRLLDCAERTGADVIYPWFDKDVQWDIWGDREGKSFDAAALREGNFIAITVLARTAAVRAVGGFREDRNAEGRSARDEYGTWLRMLDAGAKFAHLPERTWRWGLHGGNTQGLPTQGDARRTSPGLPG